MMSEYRVCRLCREEETGLVKYGTRCYAHLACLADRRGMTYVLNLPIANLRRASIGNLAQLSPDRLQDLLTAIRCADRTPCGE